jgi:phosphoribosylformimino-5-aminoimidazole carboxamide ribotide isomerase
MGFEIFPAIDLLDGKVVRLRQGRRADVTVYFDDPAEPAALFREMGATWVHVVDLNGAFDGELGHAAQLERIAQTGLRIQMGGGVRSLEAIRKRLEQGVSRCIVGTRACREPSFAGEAVDQFGAGSVAIGLDARDGKVATEGWEDSSGRDVIELAQELEGLGVRTIIATDIARDGMLTGPDREGLGRLLSETTLDVIASGGVAGPDDIEALRTLAAGQPRLTGVITGKAIYDGRLSLRGLF